MATILIIFSHGQGKRQDWGLIEHFLGGANNMDGPRGIGGGQPFLAPPLPQPMSVAVNMVDKWSFYVQVGPAIVKPTYIFAGNIILVTFE